MAAVWTNEPDPERAPLRTISRYRPDGRFDRVARFVDPADAALIALAPLLRDSLAALVALLETDIEAMTPGTDLYAEITLARELLSSLAKETDDG